MWRGHGVHGYSSASVYGIDLDGGGPARWHCVITADTASDGGGSYDFGPAVSDRALYWEWVETEAEDTWGLGRVALAPGLPDDGSTYSVKDAISPGRDACDVAATDTAIYQLNNPRCAIIPRAGRRQDH